MSSITVRSLSIGVFSLLSVVALAAMFSCSWRTPCVYEIPKGYTGWVLIEFARPDAPPLPKEHGKLLFRIGKDGRMTTSSEPKYGWAKDQFFYVDETGTKTVLKETGWGGGGQIWGASIGSVVKSGQKPLLHERFFVGSEAEFKRASDDKPKP